MLRKRMTAVLVAVMVAVSVIPGTAFAQTVAQSAPMSTERAALIDYSGQQDGAEQGEGIYMRIGLIDGRMEEDQTNAKLTVKTDPDYNSAETGYRNYIQEKLNGDEEITFRININGEKTNNISEKQIQDNIMSQIFIYAADDEGRVDPVASYADGTLTYRDFSKDGSGLNPPESNGKWMGFNMTLVIKAGTLAAGEDYVLNFGEELCGKINSSSGDGEKCPLGTNIDFYFSTTWIPVSSITLSISDATLKQGDTARLNATTVPENASNSGIVWTTSNQTVATVDSAGTVRAMGGGDAVITATAADGSGKTASCQVKVIGNVTMKVGARTYNSIKLTWNRGKGVSGYTVYRYNWKTKKYSAIKNTTARTFTNKRLTTGKKYVYKVRPYRIINGQKIYGNNSNKISTKTILAKPRKVKAKRAGKQKFRVNWKRVAGANGYKVYRSTKKNKGFKAVKTVKGRKTVKYTTGKLEKGKRYYFKVRAYRKVSGKKVYSTYSSRVSCKVR